MRYASATVLVLTMLGTGLVAATPASAKEHSIRTPSGRTIYEPHETFAEALDQTRRNFVMEVVLGYAAEGNLGINLGWLFPYVKGLEFYVGVGLQINPSVNLHISTRYFPPIDNSFRPFLSVGFQRIFFTDLLVAANNLTMEIGHKWVIHTTYHLTIGVGVRYLAGINIFSGSIYQGSDIDRDFLEDEIQGTTRWVPTLAIRLSRAF